MLKKLESRGITGLAFWDNGFKVMSANKPLKAVEDYKGLKMRIQSSKVLELQMRSLGVIPQVMARFIGLSVYQFDSNLRNSTMVGIVGGGGIGAALFTAYQRFDYDVVLTILLIIIALIILCEIASGRIRKVTQ